MILLEDAYADRDLYAAWLVAWRTPCELAEIVGRAIEQGGYTVDPAFMMALAALGAVDLADFAAANTPFETDDHAWGDHCRRRYGADPHPAETMQQRNGARATWRR